jgi:hypothetical protein
MLPFAPVNRLRATGDSLILFSRDRGTRNPRVACKTRYRRASRMRAQLQATSFEVVEMVVVPRSRCRRSDC